PKPAPKPAAIAKTPKPAPKPAAVVKTPKPAPKPAADPLPKPKWNPNSLFPNKK
ncbi:MAG: hypothetical protein H0T42_18020, partial [Deltaproteobacteria bacterium]|nr:hypothetical protein [Deltaproteobacteria bacterium]